MTRRARNRVRLNRWVRTEMRLMPAIERSAYSPRSAWRNANGMRAFMARHAEQAAAAIAFG